MRYEKIVKILLIRNEVARSTVYIEYIFLEKVKDLFRKYKNVIGNNTDVRSLVGHIEYPIQ